MPSTLNPSSFLTWKKPVVGKHPRLWISNRKQVVIGAITGGPFQHGETVSWSGGSGKVVSQTASGTSPLLYEPESGNPATSGQTLTGGTSGATTVAGSNASDHSLSLATIQARKTNASWAPDYAVMKGRADFVLTRPASYYQNRDVEEMANMCLVYLLDGNTTYRAHAISGVMHLANLVYTTSTSKGTIRTAIQSMSTGYTLLYAHFSVAQRHTIRTTCYDLIKDNPNVGVDWQGIDGSDVEFLWGTAHGDLNFTQFSLIGIMEDFTTSDGVTPDTSRCNAAVTDMDNVQDWRYAGSDTDSYFAVFRNFGNTDGGTHKGCGSLGYNVVNEGFYTRMFPAMQTGLATDWWDSEPWWKNQGHWLLWHWRPDRSFFQQGDTTTGDGGYKFQAVTQIHLLQIANRDTSIYGQACQWLVSEMQLEANQSMWGPYLLHRLLYYNPATPATEPTIAGYGGGNYYRHFEEAGHVCVRTGWKRTGPLSWCMCWADPKYFTGGHSHREAGHFQIACDMEPLVVDAGHHNVGDDTTYKDLVTPTNPSRQGHHWTYYKRGLAHNTIRIYNSAEDDTTVDRRWGFQRDYEDAEPGVNEPDSFFGTRGAGPVNNYSNYGGQRWPKDVGPPVNAEPDDLPHLQAVAAWNFAPTAFGPVQGAGGSHVYHALDLKAQYWSTKCSRYKRHFLVANLNGTTIPSYAYPVVLIWDDLITTLDAHATKGGKRTQLYQIQTQVPPTPTGTDGTDLTWQKAANAKIRQLMIRPSTPEKQVVQGFLDAGVGDSATPVLYPPENTYGYDDSLVGVYRTEINGPTASTTRNFVAFLYASAKTLTVYPTHATIDDGTWLGGTLNGIEVKIRRGDTHEAIVGNVDLSAPAIPTPNPPTGVAGDQIVTLNWNDNAEPDLAGYRVYRQEKLGAVFLSEILIASPIVSTYPDTAVENGKTYRYRVSAFDTATPPNESSPTAYSAELTPAGPPSPPPLLPSFNNRFRSSGMHFCLTVPPAPNVDLVSATDRRHSAWLFSALTSDEVVIPPDPPPDPGEGESIDCTEPTVSGASIETEGTAPLSGSSIETQGTTPLTGGSIIP